MRGGAVQPDVLNLLLNNVRTAEEREGDLGAQLAACHTGAARLREIAVRYGIKRVGEAARGLLAYSEKLMRQFLQKVPAGSYMAEDFLDDDGISTAPVKIAVQISVPMSATGSVVVDFSGSDPQVQGGLNAVDAITYSACFYVFRCLLEEDVSAT